MEKTKTPLAGKQIAGALCLSLVMLLTTPILVSAADVVERDLAPAPSRAGSSTETPQNLGPLQSTSNGDALMDSVVSNSEPAPSDSVAAEAKEEFTDGFKGVGRGFKSGTQATGRSLKKAGSTMESGFKKAGTVMGNGFKTAGRAIKDFFVGKKSSDSVDTQGYRAEGQAAQGVEQEWQDTEANDSKTPEEGGIENESIPPQENNDWAAVKKKAFKEVRS